MSQRMAREIFANLFIQFHLLINHKTQFRLFACSPFVSSQFHHCSISFRTQHQWNLPFSFKRPIRSNNNDFTFSFLVSFAGELDESQINSISLFRQTAGSCGSLLSRRFLGFLDFFDDELNLIKTQLYDFNDVQQIITWISLCWNSEPDAWTISSLWNLKTLWKKNAKCWCCDRCKTSIARELSMVNWVRF